MWRYLQRPGPLLRSAMGHPELKTKDGVLCAAIRASWRLRKYLPPYGHGKPPSHERTRRRADGSRMTLSSLPFDIIFQIFSDLEPPDVLSLARTNKSLRSFLMHSSSTPVWRAARSRMENLPPYAHDLSEPEFAHLVFDDYCDNCLAPEGGSADWKLRARYCKTCKETCLISIDKFAGPEKENRYFRQCLVFHKGWSTSYKLCCTTKARDRFAADLERVGEDSEKLAQLISRKVAAKEAVHRHALLCEQWRTCQLLSRVRKIDAVRHEERDECDVQLPSILEMRK